MALNQSARGAAARFQGKGGEAAALPDLASHEKAARGQVARVKVDHKLVAVELIQLSVDLNPTLLRGMPIFTEPVIDVHCGMEIAGAAR